MAAPMTPERYVSHEGVHYLRSLPDSYRDRVVEMMGGRAEAMVRLRLSNGQQFVMPIAIRGARPLPALLRSISPRAKLERLRNVYRRLKPWLARAGVVGAINRWAARRKIAVTVYDDHRVLYLDDDELFSWVGHDLLVADPAASAPRYIGLALTNRCNLECGMCPYHSPIEKAQHGTDYFMRGELIDPEDVKRVLDYAERSGAVVGLGQVDEPLIAMLAPRYWPLFRDSKAAMTITTNGTLLRGEDDFRRMAALRNLQSISISLDAASEESYRKIRGGDFNELRPAMIDFFKYLKRHRPEIERRVCFVAQPDNAGEESAFLEQWKPYVNIVSIYQVTQYDRESGALQFDHNFADEKRTPCGAIFDTMYVMPKMDVLPCCLFMYVSPYEGMRPIGKFDDGFWQSDDYHRFRSTVTNEQFGAICAKCTVWKQGAARWAEEDGITVSVNPHEKHYHVG